MESTRASPNDTVEPLDKAMPEAESPLSFSFISANMFLKTNMWNLLSIVMRGKEHNAAIESEIIISELLGVDGLM